jgi:hypothetical protein
MPRLLRFRHVLKAGHEQSAAGANENSPARREASAGKAMKQTSPARDG